MNRMNQCLRGWMTALTFAAAFALASAPAFGQGGATSPLAGVVADASGAVLPGADVIVKNNATGETYTTVTNGEGAFTVPALVNGTYSVTVVADGLQDRRSSAR